LAKAIKKVNAFLICYDVQRDQSKGTNYHKVMEYLGTGKVIVSNSITTYQHQPELVQMITERDNNNRLPHLFDEVISSLHEHNAIQRQKQRVEYARDNTYQKQLQRIEKIIRDEKVESGHNSSSKFINLTL
jgi:uncharacterized membrane protein YgaE (UPF0421/DUF939 family)